jgi:hypothetical protein
MSSAPGRCNSIKVPKVGELPLKDPRCILAYGHIGKHQYNVEAISQGEGDKEK